MQDDADGLRTMKAIDWEIAAFQRGNKTGLSALANRMIRAPATYVRWYASKPALLWDWDIRIGQGDVYVYPTRNSPFREQALWRLTETLCFLANPFLMLLALAGVVFAAIRSDAASIHIGLATLATLVTLVYSVLQAEPRYSSAFRGIEILLAAMAVTEIGKWMRGRRANAEKMITLLPN
jgi:hypothetical protein